MINEYEPGTVWRRGCVDMMNVKLAVGYAISVVQELQTSLQLQCQQKTHLYINAVDAMVNNNKK